MLEKAIKIDLLDLNNKNILKEIENYDWLYYGAEFCENLLPLYEKKINDLIKINKNICFLTPILTDKGIKNLYKILPLFLKFNKKVEITINDFGTLKLIKDLKLNFKINIGRHLIKHFFEVRREKIDISNREAISYINSLNINRFEFSIGKKIHKLEFIPRKEKINFTLFYPYTQLSTTRLCLMGTEEIMPEDSVKTINCKYQCLQADYYVKSEKINETLIFSKNSVFIKETEFPLKEKELKEKFINRLVFELKP